MKLRLFIDVTDLIYLRFHTGIQRAQRNIILHATALSESLDIQCNTVAYVARRCFRKLQLPEHGAEPSLGYFDCVHQALRQPWRFRRLAERVFPSNGFKIIMERFWVGYARWFLFGPLLFLILPFLLLSIIHFWFLPAKKTWIPAEGDVFFVTGASWWTFEFDPAFQYVKSKGAKIVVLIYDLIPITHPSFCDPKHNKVFSDTFKKMCSCVDMIIADSYYARTMIEDYMDRLNIRNQPMLDNFILGVNLDYAKPQGSVRSKIQESYLLVM